jgi:uncharacterized protein (TIGR00730 family)
MIVLWGVIILILCLNYLFSKTQTNKIVTVFCSASTTNEDYINESAKLISHLNPNKITIAYGGYNGGLMNVVFDSYTRIGGKIISSNTTKFKNDNKIDEYLYDSNSNDAREKKLIDIGNEYLILPGGIGTTFEFVFAMFKNNVHDFNENIFILNVNNFYDIFLQYLNLLDSQKLIKGGIKSLNIYVSSDPIDIANKINNNYRIN